VQRLRKSVQWILRKFVCCQKKKEITEGKIYNPVVNLAERAKQDKLGLGGAPLILWAFAKHRIPKLETRWNSTEWHQNSLQMTGKWSCRYFFASLKSQPFQFRLQDTHVRTPGNAINRCRIRAMRMVAKWPLCQTLFRATQIQHTTCPCHFPSLKANRNLMWTNVAMKRLPSRKVVHQLSVVVGIEQIFNRDTFLDWKRKEEGSYITIFGEPTTYRPCRLVNA